MSEIKRIWNGAEWVSFDPAEAKKSIARQVALEKEKEDFERARREIQRLSLPEMDPEERRKRIRDVKEKIKALQTELSDLTGDFETADNHK